MSTVPTPEIRLVPLRLLCLATAVALSLAPGCSSTKKHAADHAKSVSGTDEQIFIGDTIEKNYDPNVIMKRAEAFFDKEDYPEAVIEYQHFLDLHHIHMLAPYAQFKLGESHYKMAKTVDRDLEPVHKAEEAFGKLLKEFPGSRYEQEAAERIRGCHELLAQQAMFVGEFYYRRESYLAAAHRFDSILKNYPDMGVAPEAMYYLALSYKELGADDWAREQLTLLADKYPDNKNAAASQKLLAKLNGKRPLETAIAKAAPPITESPAASALRVTAADGQPTIQPTAQSSPIPAAALIPATAVEHIPGTAGIPVATFASQASNGFVPQVTLCRLGSWC